MSHRQGYYYSGRRKYYPVGSDCVLYHAYWDGTSVDHSSYGNNGTVYGATYGEYGLTLDGTNDYVEVADHASLDFTTAMSAFVWFKIGATIAVYDGLFGKASDWTSTYYMWLGVGVPILSCQLGINNYNNGPALVLPERSDAPRVWHMVSMTYDKTHVKGALENGAQSETDYTTDIATSAENLQIGRIQNNSYNLDGQIGEILFFNTAKTATDVVDYYNFTKSRYGL